MTAPAVDPFADAGVLANRIAQHLKTHPDDQQARQDLRYVVSVMKQQAPAQSAADNPPEASAGSQVASGLASVPGDVVKGVLSSVLHPVQTAGQLTGMGNRQLLRDLPQDAPLPEKFDALVRNTPLNMGYAPARAFLQSLGAKTDEPPAPLSEQVRQGGDLAASLLLTRYGVPGTKRLARAGNAALLGVPGRILEALRGKPVEAPVPKPVPKLSGPEHYAAGPLEDIGQALADRKAGRISQDDLDAAMDFARMQMNKPTTLLEPPTAPPTLLESPLLQTSAEEAATIAAKALRLRARNAARNAYNTAMTAGQTMEQAKAAAQRAASAIGLLGP